MRHIIKAGQVISKTEMVSAEQAKAAIKLASGMTWQEQAKEQERLASILLTQLTLRIESGESDDDVFDQLAKLTTMTKRFMSKDDGYRLRQGTG